MRFQAILSFLPIAGVFASPLVTTPGNDLRVREAEDAALCQRITEAKEPVCPFTPGGKLEARGGDDCFEKNSKVCGLDTKRLEETYDEYRKDFDNEENENAFLAEFRNLVVVVFNQLKPNREWFSRLTGKTVKRSNYEEEQAESLANQLKQDRHFRSFSQKFAADHPDKGSKRRFAKKAAKKLGKGVGGAVLGLGAVIGTILLWVVNLVVSIIIFVTAPIWMPIGGAIAMMSD